MKHNDNGERLLAFTTFASDTATRGARRALTWRELLGELRQPRTYAAKKACPLVKIGTFDNDSRAAGSGQSTADALVADYDAGVVAIADAIERLSAAGVTAAIYSTANHLKREAPKYNGGPRWRVVAPTAGPITEGEHETLMDALNGALGGILAPESWDWKRCYYAGRVEGVPYEFAECDGAPIDVVAMCPDFEPIPAPVRPRVTREIDRSIVVTDDPVVDFMRDHDMLTGDAAGKVFVRCPREAEHTSDTGPSSTAWLLATATEPAHFKCQHTSHGPIGDSDFLRAIGYDRPLEDFDVVELTDNERQQAEAAAKRNASKESTSWSARIDRTDAGNVAVLAMLTRGNLRFTLERETTLAWDGHRWSSETSKVQGQSAALQVAEHYHRQAAAMRAQAGDVQMEKAEATKFGKAVGGIEKWATHCRNRRSVEAMLAMARADARFAISMTSLDCDPWLFGVDNGVVDLRTGALREAAREDFVTRRSAIRFDPQARAPRWERFIAEITSKPGAGGVVARPDLASYLQKALGYSMTGSTAEHKMFLAIGVGANGKSILLDLLQWIMGNYCQTIAPEALMATRHDSDAERPSSVIAGLAGARMAVSAESRDGQRLDVSLVKRHTGGGYLTARFMRENSFRFEISHKLWLMTNCRPALDHLDVAMRGRLHLIPFDMRWNRPGHPERDPALPDGEKDLPEQLKAEAPGVLAWLVAGAVAYVRDGLEPPAAVVKLTRDFFQDQDPLGRWMASRTRAVPAKQGVQAARLYDDFMAWAAREDEEGGPTSQKAFGIALRGRGVAKHEGASANTYALEVLDGG